MDLFDKRDIKPMLIGEMLPAFDSHDYIYELKLDGERCIAYLDENHTDLRNKRNMKLLGKVPELSNINKQVKHKCILDGELIIVKEGKPDFSEIQRRTITSNSFKIQIGSNMLPATFTAFDILYYDNHEVNHLPLLERKALLEKIIDENERLAVSRYIEYNGIKLFDLAKEQQLEGVVAKRKDSKYYFDKRTKDWIKMKNLLDDDFVVCGYTDKGVGLSSIVIGQYSDRSCTTLIYMGHVALGISSSDYRQIQEVPKTYMPFHYVPSGNNEVVWIEPKLVCTVKYMMKTSRTGLRQPVFKTLRADKVPEECVISD